MHKQLSILPDPLDAAAGPPFAQLHAPRRPPWWAALLGLGPAALLLLQLFPALDMVSLHSPLAHVVIALTAAGLGMVLALLVLHVARMAHDARVFLIGMGFLCTASIFVTHAIATPNVLLTDRGFAASIAAPLSLVLGGLCFALSGLPISATASHSIMRHVRLVTVAYLVCWLCFNWVVLVFIPANTLAGNHALAAETGYAEHTGQPTATGEPDENYEQPDAHTPAAVASAAVQTNKLPVWVLVVGLAAFGFATYRQYQLYRHTPSNVGFALVLGIALLGEALITQYFSRVYSVSFWLYHSQEFVGFGAISYAMLVSYRRGLDESSLLESVLLPGTRARISVAYAEAMDTLIAMLDQGAPPAPAAREALRTRFNLSDAQLQAFEGAAQAVAQERRQRQELEHLNQALRQLEQHKHQLTQMVVHDLKNPLTALTAYLDILRQTQLEALQQDLVLGALSSSKNLAGLIGDLLDSAQIEEGQLVLEYSTFAIGDLLRQCIDELHGWLQQEGKSIQLDVPHDSPLVSADIRLLRRVILNLLSNAIKHTPAHTRIELRARAQGAQAEPSNPQPVVIEVVDTGYGIPADQLEQIFERFGRYQGAPLSGRQTSTGLGLTFCRLVALAHGGSIEVASVVGRGTTFRVILPYR